MSATAQLRCIDQTHAIAVYEDVVRRGAPASTSGRRVTLPADQPGFFMAVVETALDEGHITDDAGAQAIADMKRALWR